jgi:putative phosphoribosyl transferase
VHQSVAVEAAGTRLNADVAVPDRAQAVVMFAHGAGSSRRSPRNRFVARELQHSGLATVLADLLTPREEQLDVRTAHLRFDIDLLATRVVALTDWVSEHDQTSGRPLGLFGASTGAGAALVAAAERPDLVGAIVSRGGRPDLAGDDLRRVRQPTLLIVGGRDELVIDLNRRAIDELAGDAPLAIVRGATHLFEEPGALEEVAVLARDWFVRYLL